MGDEARVLLLPRGSARVGVAVVAAALLGLGVLGWVWLVDDPVASNGSAEDRVLVLYGDSLATEADDAFTLAFADHPDVEVVVRAFGGTAICDWLGDMAEDADTLQPFAVVIEFAGNDLTECMTDDAGRPLEGEAYLDRYRTDAEKVVDIFAGTGTQIVFAGTPPDDSETDGFGGGALDEIYQQVAEGHDDVSYTDAGASVLDDGEWTKTLPCLEGEPCTGGKNSEGEDVNVVRSPDGGHFCPVEVPVDRGAIGECPVWSSGAFRYGQAMAAPVIAMLG